MAEIVVYIDDETDSFEFYEVEDTFPFWLGSESIEVPNKVLRKFKRLYQQMDNMQEELEELFYLQQSQRGF